MKGKKIITFVLCVLLSLGLIATQEISIFAFAEGADPAAITSLPSSVDLSSQFPTPSMQIGGSCSAWATCYALMSQAEYREYHWTVNNTTHAFSPQYLYYQIGNGSGFTSNIYNYASKLKSQGCCTLPYYPIISQESSLTSPSNLQKENAKLYKVASYQTVIGLNNMKKKLANGCGIAVEILAYDSFEQMTPANNVYSSINTSENSKGHSLCVVGYDDNLYGGVVKVLNSWGTDWGLNGYAYITYNVFGQICYGGLGSLNLVRGLVITSLSPDTFLLGDVDGDGSVSAIDARLVLRFSVSLEVLTDAQQAIADVNGDGEADAQDASSILSYSVGSISMFPLYN
ncbi:MAG: hypothetical protein IJK02_08215 [Clostridia bacterium]|nr:hypothetical protein [Clostridia bacterium]